jgi:hypothetical protein
MKQIVAITREEFGGMRCSFLNQLARDGWELDLTQWMAVFKNEEVGTDGNDD